MEPTLRQIGSETGAAMIRSTWKMGAVAEILAGTVAWPGAVTAQPTKPPELVTRTSLDVPTIVGQLRMAKQFGKTALDAFEAMPADDLIVTAKSLGDGQSGLPGTPTL
jgi:hypothetical protein